MNSRFTEQPDLAQGRMKKPRARNRRVVGGGIILALLALVGAFAAGLVLRSSHSSALASGGEPTPTPTIGTPPPGTRLPQGSLYAATPGSLVRIDLKTGQVLWSIQAGNPIAPLVVGRTVFFENADSSNSFVEAANAKTGAQLWQIQNSGNGFLVGANHRLYDSLCNFSTGACALYGLNADTGAQLWSYDLHQGTAWITLANGVIYGVSYTHYFALNAATGAPLWEKDLLNYTDQEANMTPVVRGNVLSFASCNTTKQSTGFPGCYLYAFNASTGAELWHMATNSTIMATPAIMGGVVYAGTIDGTLLALNEQSGQQLWSASTGGLVGQVLTSSGTVYVEIVNPDGQSFQVEAFDAATHAQRWSQIGFGGQAPASPLAFIQHAGTLPSHPSVPHSGGPASHPFVLSNGFIFLQDGPDTISVLKASDGTLLNRYTVPGGALYGFAIAD